MVLVGHSKESARAAQSGNHSVIIDCGWRAAFRNIKRRKIAPRVTHEVVITAHTQRNLIVGTNDSSQLIVPSDFWKLFGGATVVNTPAALR